MICKTGKFTIWEQLWQQVSFNGIWILGTYAIFKYNPILAVIYVVVFPFFGIIFCIMHLWLCPRCPHIKEYSSCVQLPPFLTKRIIAKDKKGLLKLYEKMGFFVIYYGIFLFPIFFIVKIDNIILPYFLFVFSHYLAALLFFCRKCLNINCPQSMKK